jgi:hypothetical protein
MTAHASHAQRPAPTPTARLDNEAEVITIGTDPLPPHSGRIVWRLRPLRRIVELLLVGAVIAAALVVANNNSDRPPAPIVRPPEAGPVVQDAARARPPIRPRLVAPASARAGERVTVMGFAYQGLCGPTSFRFDGVHVEHDVISVAASTDSSWVGTLMTVEVPAAATAGPHVLDLYGPIPGGGRWTTACGDMPEHVGRLGDATVDVVR